MVNCNEQEEGVLCCGVVGLYVRAPFLILFAGQQACYIGCGREARLTGNKGRPGQQVEWKGRPTALRIFFCHCQA